MILLFGQRTAVRKKKEILVPKNGQRIQTLIYIKPTGF